MSNHPSPTTAPPRVVPRVIGATAVSLAGGTLFVGGQPVHAASFDVSSLNESGPGSLNYAIRDANDNPGLDTITFSVTGTIALTSGYSLPAITDDVIIQGPGSALLTLDGTYAECDIIRNWDDVDPQAPYGAPVDITISGVTITHADCDAIDIEYASSLTLDDIVATNNASSGLFVSNVSTVTVSNSDFSTNGEHGIYVYAFLTDAAPSSTFVSDITLTNVTAKYNTTYGMRANASSGNYASFDITIVDSTFSYNDDNGLVVYNPWDFSEVTLTPSVTITNSDFSHNGGDGIAIEYGRDVTLDGVTASYNAGYGVYIDYSLTVSVVDSTFNENDNDGLKVWTSSDEDTSTTTVSGVTADGNGDSGLSLDGATISVRNSTVSGNGDGMDLDAAGNVDLPGRSITVANSTVSNSVSHGINVEDASDVTISETTVDGSGYEGVIVDQVASARIENSTISNSGALDSRAGIRLEEPNWNQNYVPIDETLTIVNSTITGSAGDGIEVRHDAYPRWIYDVEGQTYFTRNLVEDSMTPATVVIAHSTITGNTGDGVSSGASFIAPVASTVEKETYVITYSEETTTVSVADDVTISNSIVSGNDGTDASDVVGTVAVSWSLVDSGSEFAGSGNNIAADDPKLGALADNGGETLTMLPLSGSPAINAGNPAVSGAPATDQRGETRIFGVAIDIGAVETDVPGSTTTTTTTPTTTVPSGGVLPPTGGGDRNGLAAGAAALLIGLGAAMSRLTRRRTA